MCEPTTHNLGHGATQNLVETQIHGRRVIERGREGVRCRRSKAEAKEEDKVKVATRVDRRK